MRSCPLQFEGRSCLVSRVVLAFCLAVTLIVTPFVSASSTQATVASRPHTKRLRSSHAKTTRRQAELHRVAVERERRARYHRRRKTYARTHRLSVTLDQVHSHAATLAETAAPSNAPLPPLASPPTDEDATSTGNTPISRNMPHLQYLSSQLYACRTAWFP